MNSDPVLLFSIDAGPGKRGFVVVPLGKINWKDLDVLE